MPGRQAWISRFEAMPCEPTPRRSEVTPVCSSSAHPPILICQYDYCPLFCQTRFGAVQQRPHDHLGVLGVRPQVEELRL